MKRKILIILLILFLILSIFPYAMLIHGKSDDEIDYVTAQEYVEVSNSGYQDPLLNTCSIPFTKSTYVMPYFSQSNGIKTFYNGYHQQMYGEDVKMVIDISEHNQLIDFEQVKKAGVDGIIIRAGWGAGGVDNYFEYNLSECNRLGIPYGLYLYSYAYDANFAYREAKDLIALLSQYDLSNLKFPIYYDLEQFDSWNDNGIVRNPPKSVATYNEIVKTFVEAFETAGYHQKVHVYSYCALLNSYMNSAYIHSLTSWVAEYGPTLNFTNSYYQGASGWQYTSDGRVEGITTRVDMNVFSDYLFKSSEQITFVEERTSIYQGMTSKLKVKMSDYFNQEILFISDDPKLCSVDSTGRITAIKAGTTTIRMMNTQHQIFDEITVEVLAPCVVNNLKITQTDMDEVLLTWDAHKDAQGYEIYISESNQPFYLMDIVDRHILQYYVGYLPKYSNVAFKIKAVTVLPNCDISDVVSHKLTLLPSNIRSWEQMSPTSIRLRYQAVKGAKYYDIYRASSTAKTYRKQIRTSQNEFIDSGLVPGKAYDYKVRCIDGNLVSKFSAPYRVKTKLDTPTFSIKKTSQIKLTINKSSGATYYQVYCRKVGNKSFQRLITLKSNNLTYVHKNAKKATYEYKVRCYREVDGVKVYSSFSTIKKISNT